MYGNAIYFASEACKSHQYTCDNRCTKACACPNERTLIVARVALGHSFYTQKILKNVKLHPVRSHIPAIVRFDNVIANRVDLF